MQTDIRYSDRSARCLLDLTLPEGVTRPPLVVYIHGGAFFLRDKSDGAAERQALLAAGFAVASVNYRLTDEAIWPAQMDDLKAAFAWLRAHADALGFDGARIASFGPSAGGHLSASIGIALAADPATALDASVIWFPPVDFPTMDADIEATGIERATGRNDGARSPESLLIGSTVADNPALARAAGPIARIAELPPGARLPDMLVMHGALDPYIAAAQGRRLHAAVAAHGTASRLDLDILPWGTHGGGEFEEPRTMTRVTRFLADSFARADRRTGLLPVSRTWSRTTLSGLRLPSGPPFLPSAFFCGFRAFQVLRAWYPTGVERGFHPLVGLFLTRRGYHPKLAQDHRMAWKAPHHKGLQRPGIHQWQGADLGRETRHHDQAHPRRTAAAERLHRALQPHRPA
jgi:acetyl esterase/lipase